MELELLIKVVYIYIIKRDKKIMKKDKERLFSIFTLCMGEMAEWTKAADC